MLFNDNITIDCSVFKKNECLMAEGCIVKRKKSACRGTSYLRDDAKTMIEIINLKSI